MITASILATDMYSKLVRWKFGLCHKFFSGAEAGNVYKEMIQNHIVWYEIYRTVEEAAFTRIANAPLQSDHLQRKPEENSAKDCPLTPGGAKQWTASSTFPATERIKSEMINTSAKQASNHKLKGPSF